MNGPLIRKNAEENNEAHFKTRLVWKEAFQRVIISSGRMKFLMKGVSKNLLVLEAILSKYVGDRMSQTNL